MNREKFSSDSLENLVNRLQALDGYLLSDLAHFPLRFRNVLLAFLDEHYA